MNTNTTQLLARYGFESEDLQFNDCGQRSLAGEILHTTLKYSDITLNSLLLSEQTWIEVLHNVPFHHLRLGGECLIDPTKGELPLADIDLHMRGICRWMNAMGMHTLHCCDGHGKRTPRIGTLHRLTRQQIELLQTLAPAGLTIRVRDKSITMDCGNQTELLLTLAERLYEYYKYPVTLKRYKAELFKHQLIQWLSLPGESGNEEQIRRQIYRKLVHKADDLFIDRAGNLCATIHCGEGPTVLLSAHMDIYQEFDEQHQIIQDGLNLHSTEGILGADDRAGITIILELVKQIHRTNFNGTLKLAFTVEEEISLIGSQALEPHFLNDVDAAIVVDRRGTRDIVTSCGGFIPFCNEPYGKLFEAAGRLAGMDDWKVIAGGSSDARILAQNFGIPSVNLSAGYMNEHTALESVNYVAAYETFELIRYVLHNQMIEIRDRELCMNK